MSHFITSPFSNRISNFSTLTNSQITFALPLTPIDFTSNSPLSKKSRTIENNNNNITSFKENNDKKFEEDCYPKINVIRYQGKHTYYYQYNILDLGNYPTNVMYKVTWEEKDGKKCCVNSLRSASDAAKQFVQKITNAKGSTLSGVILFGLDLECIELRRENKENILPINLKKKKPFSNLKSRSQKNKRLKKLALDINSNTKDLFDSHRFSNINLDKGYRQLSTVQPSLEREWHLAVRKKEINLIMENKIPIKNFNINPINEFSIIQENNENNSTIYLNENIEKIIINKDQIENGSIKSLIGLLITLIPDLTEAHNQIIEELTTLYNNGFTDENNNHWKIEFWFTGDWKYMALVLEINGPTSNYFCLWCKVRTSLLPFLTPKYCIPDELHLMLQIVDVLLECFFLELMRDALAFDTTTPQENISTREKIKITMQEIGITTFKFIPPEKKTKTAKWSWHTLMGPAKLKIIEKFPVSKFIIDQRGKDIENLWKDFYYLYCTMRRENLTEKDIIQFSQDACKWVKEFARPTKKTKTGKIEQEGLYQRTDVTPYMHVLAFHIPLFMQELLQQNLCLRWFTTSGIEKKNHEHVRLFFGETTMGGGTEQTAAYQINSFENRQIYYRINKTPTSYSEKVLTAFDKINE
ncbi:hypothetical protein Glove_170g34 [Diversispora epigaea]|uniref:Uncharacterized protein n=1 Tax=Diversispora epigaea TaxID=1348612 RepID=A0A397IY92_9GLOM|nr:hypothetical protein Glove_170g34 [Diversispora epigaea]